MIKTITAVMLALCAGALQAATTPTTETEGDKVAEFLASIRYRTGDVTLGNGLVKLSVPPEFQLVEGKQAEQILQFWGNPPSTVPPLGMLFPSGMTPVTKHSWAVVIEYEESGYVQDNDADKIDYAELLATMKEGTREASSERVKQGYEPVELIGWATPPRYDATAHKMYWAKEIKFGDSPDHTLNYNIRVLGRRGVLVLNAIAGMDQLAAIDAVKADILSMVDFTEGHRYVDFNPETDRYAAYGLAALVAGGVAAKAGLFKGLIVALLAAKKFVIIGLVAIFGFLKNLFRKKERTPTV